MKQENFMSIRWFLLHKNCTWDIVETYKMKVISYKCFYKRKPCISGVGKLRFKTIIVAKGFSYYKKVFAPVMKHVSIGIKMSLVANEDLELENLDVKTAFYMVHWIRQYKWSAIRV